MKGKKRLKRLNLPRAPQMKKSGTGAHRVKKGTVKHKKLMGPSWLEED